MRSCVGVCIKDICFLSDEPAVPGCLSPSEEFSGIMAVLKDKLK